MGHEEELLVDAALSYMAGRRFLVTDEVVSRAFGCSVDIFVGIVTVPTGTGCHVRTTRHVSHGTLDESAACTNVRFEIAKAP